MERHEKESPQCSWVLLRFPNANTNYTVNEDDPDTYPRSRTMRDARLKTFTRNHSWPQRRSLIPASKLADAGFYYAPTPDMDDKVTCIYCQCNMRGTDKTTRPLRRARRDVSNENTTATDTDDAEDWASASSKTDIQGEAGSNHQKLEVGGPVTRQSVRLQAKTGITRKRKSTEGEMNESYGEEQKQDTGGSESTAPLGESPLDDSIWDIDKALDKEEQKLAASKHKQIFTYSKRQRKKMAPILPDELTKIDAVESQELQSVASQGSSYISKLVIDTKSYITPSGKERDQLKQAQAKTLRVKGKGKDIAPVPPTKKVTSLSKSKATQVKDHAVSGRVYQGSRAAEKSTGEDGKVAGFSRAMPDRMLSLDKTMKPKEEYLGEKSSLEQIAQGPSKASASAHPTTQDRLEFPYMDDDLDDDLASFNVSPIRPEGDTISRWPGFPAGGILHSTPITSLERKKKAGRIFTESGPVELLRRPSPPKSPTRSYQEKRKRDMPEVLSNMMAPVLGKSKGKQAQLGEDQLNMTVEDYLRSLVDKEIEAVRKRGEEQIREIKDSVKRIRQDLLSYHEKNCG
ncbi:hypothetical protein DFQ28_000008 [Apophysomyces sp. BC1034]|nr:hypothetical protein DFQ30_005481 [Apophysomyces sp. BC1015]KAG0182768.1 hypothetical protein DFQ29_002180 [Apophysomyces sp. BC1021]KAG0194909.1 hypothetical protein DFQ28_000008 [Apophysomyces sp. BC1034]